FSELQNKSQVCCLREQVEKKNGELKSLRQRVSRSDSQVRKLQEKLDELRRVSVPYPSGLLSPSREPPKMNPVVEPLSWMLDTWLSDPPGAGTYPTLQPFQYLEEVHISHVGQPMLNFSFNSFHPDTRKPMHRECGFIRLKPDTNKVAFVSAQNTGVVEVEEGEVNGQELCIASHSIARISFAKEPHVGRQMKGWPAPPHLWVFLVRWNERLEKRNKTQRQSIEKEKRGPRGLALSLQRTHAGTGL
uniref:THAP4-like heme-binding domain-containing protein n=1 Tax=Papio anubis TaxID=9555 RepID=A0A8I5NZ24_PAPAN